MRAFAIDESFLFGQEHIEIDFAERWGLMDNAGARIDCDKICRDDTPCDVLSFARLEPPLNLAKLR